MEVTHFLVTVAIQTVGIVVAVAVVLAHKVTTLTVAQVPMREMVEQV